MFKNQLQELAQRSCFNLPSYSCVREGPDHAPRFKSTVTFNGESFESPGFCNTLRQAEHAAAEVALNTLSKRGPTQSLAARILDETGVCKNLLQETAQRAGIILPAYSVERSGPGHMPVFVSVVKVAGLSFAGESAKTKKQAEKNAATAAWASLKQLVIQASASSSSSSDSYLSEEQMQIAIARFLTNANPESSTIPQSQGPPPPLSRPVPTSRIRITPFEEQPVIVPSPSSLMSMETKADNKGTAASSSRIRITPVEEQPVIVPSRLPLTSMETKADNKGTAASSSRIRITPFEEQPGQAALNMLRHTPHFSIEAKADNASQQEQEVGGKNLNDESSQVSCRSIVDEISTPESQMRASGSGNRVQQGAAHVQMVTINHLTHSQVTYLPVNELLSDDQNWFHGGSSTFIVTDGGSSDNVLPVVHPGYTHVVWTGEDSQYPSTVAAYKPLACMAPRVRVRQAIPVCSAPPRMLISDVKDQVTDDTEAAALQGLGDLKL